jgi:hypothetical protein
VVLSHCHIDKEAYLDLVQATLLDCDHVAVVLMLTLLGLPPPVVLWVGVR